MSPLTTIPFGPWTGGVHDTANPSVPQNQVVRSAQNLIYTGLFELSVRPGTQTVLTLMDDQGTPAPITSVVLAATPFQQGALAIGYSSVTQKCYLYSLNATMDGWYDSSGTFTATAFPEPLGVLWSSMSGPPDVSVTEGLGVAYIANTNAADVAGLYWPTKTYDGTTGLIANYLVNGTGGNAGTDVAYFTGVCAFQQALWGFGYGAGNTPGYTSYRPELARFSPPDFDDMQVEDSLTIGDRVRSERERIIAGVSAGNSLYLGGASLLTRITGYGRDSWYKTVLDRSYGFVGPKCAIAVAGTLYYWSAQGPLRVTDTTAPDPLWDAIPAAVSNVANPASIVAGFDLATNQVFFFYDTGSGVRTFCAFDVRREVWLGPDADIGLPIVSAGIIQPLFTPAPAGPPIAISTTSIGNTSAVATWTNGDPLAETEISLYNTLTGWTVFPFLPAGTTTYTFSSLSVGTAYQWRVRHVRGGQYSVYSSTLNFTTSATTLSPPTNCTASIGGGFLPPILVKWTNSGAASVQTEVWIKVAADADFSKIQTVAYGVSSTTVFYGNNTAGPRSVKVRHILNGGLITSPFSNTATT